MTTPHSLRLAYYSATATEIPSLSGGAQRFLNQHRDAAALTVYARTQTQLFDESRCRAFVREALKAQVCIIGLHGGKLSCPAFELFVEELAKVPEAERPLIHVQPTGGDEDSQIYVQLKTAQALEGLHGKVS